VRSDPIQSDFQPAAVPPLLVAHIGRNRTAVDVPATVGARFALGEDRGQDLDSAEHHTHAGSEGPVLDREPAIDYAVRMREFPSEARLDRQIANGMIRGCTALSFGRQAGTARSVSTRFFSTDLMTSSAEPHWESNGAAGRCV